MAKNNLAPGKASRAEQEFQARMDLDTINRACEIQRDKGRMNAAMKLAKRQMENVNGGGKKVKK